MRWSEQLDNSYATNRTRSEQATARLATPPTAPTVTSDSLLTISWRDACVLEHRVVFAAELLTGKAAGARFLIVEVVTPRTDGPFTFMPQMGNRCLWIENGLLRPAFEVVSGVSAELLTRHQDWDQIGAEYTHGKRRWRILGPDDVRGMAADGRIECWLENPPPAATADAEPEPDDVRPF